MIAQTRVSLQCHVEILIAKTDQKPDCSAPGISKGCRCLANDIFRALLKSGGNTRSAMLNPLTDLYLCTHAQLSTPPPQIIGRRNCRRFIHCTIRSRSLQPITIIMMGVWRIFGLGVRIFFENSCVTDICRMDIIVAALMDPKKDGVIQRLQRKCNFTHESHLAPAILRLRNTLICKSVWVFGELTWNPAQSLDRVVFEKLNVPHQAA
ncbi:hypothetical protein T265_00675 [Opisthorchis viverrini]|uniref:Uncharacterized protein n=1 Tax=Opisthorchis viverrini TaxID=6198 RepID=A0A075A5J4_OPIVI|nr:hypothetical protein T265_00675 [Opisthorchis viverrini]KER33577.1 hypothetical protein T265_00675 [Opisthorchis viverrini]